MLEVSSSSYYAGRGRPQSERVTAKQTLVEEIKDILLMARKTYGSPRVHADLIGRGFSASKNQVAPLRRAETIRARLKKKRKKTTNCNHSYPIAPNLLNRDFQADKPNQKWLGDITCIWTSEGWRVT